MTNAITSPLNDGESIFLTLRGENLSGVHTPGRPVREASLAGCFGVSRLQQERLLERVAREL